MENPAIAAAQKATGKALPGVGWTPFTGGQKASTGHPGGTNGPLPKAVAPEGNSSVPAVIKGEVLPLSQADALDKRYPGASRQILTVRHQDIQEVLAEIGADPHSVRPGMTDAEIASTLPPNLRKDFNKQMVKLRRDQADDYKTIGGLVAPKMEKVTAYRQLAQDMDLLEVTARTISEQTGKQVTPDQLTSIRTDQLLGAGFMKKFNEFTGAGASENKWQAQRQAIQNAVDRYKQLKMGAVSAYFKAQSGAAISENEQKRLDQVISDGARFQSVRQFHDMFSGQAEAEQRASVGTAKYALTKTLWNLRMGMGAPKGNRVAMEGPPPMTTHPDGPGNTGRIGKERPPAKGSKEDPEVQRAMKNLKTLYGKTANGG
jgi:hypothetical protein